MALTDQPDLEPLDDGGSPEPPQAKAPSSRKSLTNLRRELSDDELKSPAVQKLLIDEIERLEEEAATAKQYVPRFYTADKKSAVLEEKLTTARSSEIIHIACITVGGVSLGATSASWILGVIGGVLIVAGIAAKAVKL